jgi:hypothetical protein
MKNARALLLEFLAAVPMAKQSRHCLPKMELWNCRFYIRWESSRAIRDTPQLRIFYLPEEALSRLSVQTRGHPCLQGNTGSSIC